MVDPDNNAVRASAERFLSEASQSELHAAIVDPLSLLNQLAPGLSKCHGCSQGSAAHLEGDVAVHTALVFYNLKRIEQSHPALRLGFIDYLAAVLHDIEKPATRVDHGGGVVKFPGHEALAAERVSLIAAGLELAPEEQQKLHFLVAQHGRAHDFIKLTAEEQRQLMSSPFAPSLIALQSADAASCLLPGGATLPSHWGAMGKVLALCAE